MTAKPRAGEARRRLGEEVAPVSGRSGGLCNVPCNHRIVITTGWPSPSPPPVRSSGSLAVPLRAAAADPACALAALHTAHFVGPRDRAGAAAASASPCPATAASPPCAPAALLSPRPATAASPATRPAGPPLPVARHRGSSSPRAPPPLCRGGGRCVELGPGAPEAGALHQAGVLPLRRPQEEAARRRPARQHPYSLASLELQERDITTNSEWERLYQYEIPVLAKVLPDGTEHKWSSSRWRFCSCSSRSSALGPTRSDTPLCQSSQCGSF
ncbi:hypothetical protein ZWY2020_013483 [Hordeum vulgare]|nr:hypothetical protein ZWY2020_013483 [Hordeum vulgare]